MPGSAARSQSTFRALLLDLLSVLLILSVVAGCGGGEESPIEKTVDSGSQLVELLAGEGVECDDGSFERELREVEEVGGERRVHEQGHGCGALLHVFTDTDHRDDWWLGRQKLQCESRRPLGAIDLFILGANWVVEFQALAPGGHGLYVRPIERNLGTRAVTVRSELRRRYGTGSPGDDQSLCDRLLYGDQ